ncbi:hypothetical protein AX16_002215 [Volvariella volvacea WC 439]|nr:hypothetical protein AX16_002215 [Volvariella volvacea WC 439]
MHHNIPDQDDSPMKVAWLKIRTTLYALVAPEMVIMWAIRQRIMAGRIAEQNKHRGWTRTHGFFVQMGGLMQRVDDGGEVTYRVAGVTTPSSPSVNWTAVKIPRIPEKEIKDHGKGDLLAKVIVVLQTTWFVAQCIARHVQGLVLTEIELVTLAFATLNVVTYGVWWDKPLSIEYPIYFDENGVRADGPEEKKSNDPWYRWFWTRKKEYGYDVLEGGDEAQPHRQGVMKTIWIKGITTPFVAIFRPLADMIEEVGDGNRETSVHPFHASNMSGDDQSLAVIYGSTIGVVFGGIHLIGWNFQFPTLPELWLWRASSLVLTVVPFNLIIGYAFNIAFLKTSNSSLERLYEGIVHVFLYPIGFVGAPLYFVARIVILSLAFFTLRDLSESAYENVRWTEFIPHI